MMFRSRRLMPPAELLPDGFNYVLPPAFLRLCTACEVTWRGTADSACWCCGKSVSNY